MKRINQENINTPDFFNKKFTGEFGMEDMERLTQLAKYYKGGTYLDVGCMDSPMPAFLADRFPGSKIFALDFAEEIIDFFTPRFPKVRYKHIHDATKLPFKDKLADYIVAGELIEHLEDPQKFFDEAFRVLRPGGWLVISTPYKELEAQGSIGGKQHLWSFDEEDLNKFMDNPEIILHKDPGGISMIAWKQKE